MARDRNNMDWFSTLKSKNSAEIKNTIYDKAGNAQYGFLY